MRNNHQVKFSMTTDTKLDGKTKFVVINMRAGDLWFITGFDEIDGHMFSWDLIKAWEMLIKHLEINDD